MPFDPNIKREMISNHYFKDSGNHAALMSGCAMPVGEDDVVRNVIFMDCDIHPACHAVKIDQCEFRECHVSDWTRGKAEENQTWTNCLFTRCS